MKKVNKLVLTLMCALVICAGLNCALKAKAFGNSESSRVYAVSDVGSASGNYEPDSPSESFFFALGYISVPIAIIVLIIVAIVSSTKKKKNPYPQQYNGYGAGSNPGQYTYSNAQHRFCANCGTKIVNGAAYCVKCGAKT